MVKTAAYNKFKLLTNPAARVYSADSVLKTPPIADSPAPESRGFFTSIVYLWPGVRLIKNLPWQGIRQPSIGGFEPPATLSKRVNIKTTYRRPLWLH